VIGLGESSVDHVYRLPAPPAANVKMEVVAQETRYGGQVATALCTCAALGLRPSYAGVFGSDPDGIDLRDTLALRGVDVSCAAARPGRHRSAVILVDAHTGDRSIFWSRDAGLALRPDDLDTAHLRSARLLHVDNVDEEAAVAAARIARDAGIPVTCDIDRVTTLTPTLLGLVTLPILAAHVPEALTGERDAGRALRRMRGSHGGHLTVTLGARGALMLAGDELHRVAGHAVRVVDTTGAGDVFRGAFIDAYLRGEPPVSVLRFANAAAALGCTKPGAIDSIPTREQIDDLLASDGA
jgi:sugar/nucleoside kinase (ribokinase family)